MAIMALIFVLLLADRQEQQAINPPLNPNAPMPTDMIINVSLTSTPLPTIPPDIQKLLDYSQQHAGEGMIISAENGAKIIIPPTPNFPMLNEQGTPMRYWGIPTPEENGDAPSSFVDDN